VGTYRITLVVTDSNGGQVTSSELTFTVSMLPTVGAVSASRPSADAGQSVTFSAPTTPGSGNDTFAWTGLPSGCAAATDPLTCTVFLADTYTARLTVTDSNGASSGSSGPFLFTVYADPAATLEASRSVVDENESLTLTTVASLGSGGFTYAYSGLPPGCIGMGVTVACSPTATGLFTVKVKVTDSNGWSATADPLTLTVGPSLSASLSINPLAPTAGQVVTFTGSGRGGTGVFTYAWTFGDGSTGSGASASHAYGSTGTFTVWLWVNDTAGGSVEKTLSLKVGPAPAAGDIFGVPPLVFGGVIAIAAVVAASVLMVRWSRPRQTKPNASPSMAGRLTQPKLASFVHR
jgi:hypothetical protein